MRGGCKKGFQKAIPPLSIDPTRDGPAGRQTHLREQQVQVAEGLGKLALLLGAQVLLLEHGRVERREQPARQHDAAQAGDGLWRWWWWCVVSLGGRLLGKWHAYAHTYT